MPPIAPRLQKNSECHSSFTFFKTKSHDRYDHWRACWFKENSYLHPKNSEWCSRHAWWKTLSCDVINTIYLVYFGHQIEFGFAHIMIIPTDWIMTLKSLATVGAIPRAKVITWRGWESWDWIRKDWNSPERQQLRHLHWSSQPPALQKPCHMKIMWRPYKNVMTMVIDSGYLSGKRAK